MKKYLLKRIDDLKALENKAWEYQIKQKKIREKQIDQIIFARNELEKAFYFLNKSDKAKESIDYTNLEKIVNQFVKEELPDSNVPFHPQSEIASIFKIFLNWVKKQEI